MKIEAGVISGGLRVLRPAEKNKNGKKMWMCECLTCGKEKAFQESDLKLERRKTCGCGWLSIEQISGQKHGGANTRLYNAWKRMVGMATISTETKRVPVFEPWKEFANFRKWAYENGYNPEFDCRLERINKRLGFFPENCRYHVKDRGFSSGRIDPKYFG